MNKENINPAEQPTTENVALEGSTYEILKKRLLSSATELKSRIDKLNDTRKAVFGAIETELVATERITTFNNCTPWDMIPLGSQFIFGYNVTIGLKSVTALEDVFSVYEYSDHTFKHTEADFLKNERFLDEFKNLYKYYRETQFVKFAKRGANLFMIFRIGKSITDIKAFKWEIGQDNQLTYVDGRSEHELQDPPQHEFEWKKVTRNMHVKGDHPHASIEDIVFVETIGGDLTIKVENNTESGQGIYAEPVDQRDQTLDDAEMYYAIVGNIVLLKIKPYQEKDFRYLAYNSKIQEARRIDAIEDSCVLLPESHGLIFSKGYYLQNGEYKLFENSLDNMLFERKIASSNGEDYLYVFYNKAEGVYLLLSYNLIEQTVRTPIVCHGFSIFANGELCFFRADNEPKKHHVVQIWQTTFFDADQQPLEESDSYLYKIGNKDIVHAMAECQELMSLLHKGESYANLYVDIMEKSNDILDSYYWLDKEETCQINEPVQEIKETASNAIDEYEKVVNIRKSTNESVKATDDKTDELLRRIKREAPKEIDEYVSYLTELRILRGEIISLKDLRYVDEEQVVKLEQSVAKRTDELAEVCVTFLDGEEALIPFEKKVESYKTGITELTKVIDADELEKAIQKTASELEMLIDIVSNLKIADATKTTSIIESISGIYTGFNQINLSLKKKRKELRGVEGKAEFISQIKLIEQGLINFLDISDTPEKCDENMTKLMVRVEELEGKFSEFDEFVEKVAVKREEVYNAFESKRVSLVEARNKRANTLMNSADRILKATESRLARFETVSEINGYMAGDLMIEKVRNIIEELRGIGDTVKAGDIEGKLKSVKEDATRQLKDKTELYTAGEGTISMGDFAFYVNNQKLELTIVTKDNTLYYHLTGTDFFEKVEDDFLNQNEHFFNQSYVSENSKIYRSEYLAYKVYQHLDKTAKEVIQHDKDYLLNETKQFIATRFNEGYIKGVHDADAVNILETYIKLTNSAGVLKYPAVERSLAHCYFRFFLEEEKRKTLDRKIKASGVILQVFPDSKEFSGLIQEIKDDLQEFNKAYPLFDGADISLSAEYLHSELAEQQDFTLSQDAHQLIEDFLHYLEHEQKKNLFEQTRKQETEWSARFTLIRNWLSAFNQQATNGLINEASIFLINDTYLNARVKNVSLQRVIEGLQGTHALIEEEKYTFDLLAFDKKLHHYSMETVPLFEQFQACKKEACQHFAEDLKLETFKPRVMSSFVRNQLIDKVYLKLIGANLAKQIGSAGENKRTDLMGMLLLISPPGYGKTTLMEYIANRLGLIFMKINGPSIGHEVTSVDPESAPNASAREELQKLNLSFEMGNNVMIYLDDIQHCNPEFLQKFISLCDAQRKIEGVYKGKSKTYDFRGKKVCVVMSGNPYTESGDKFQIPDMLANRADIYNLGDILGDTATEFKSSYIENCLTSNPIVNKLASKSHKDVLTLLHAIETGDQSNIEFEVNHSRAEITEYTNILQKLIRIRNVVLKVNMQYIESAAQADEYRTEPPFKLQGSYRNMNKMAEKVVPIMNDEELENLIIGHYEGESQTLTTGAEANVLKFKELIATQTETDQERWTSIKETFVKNNKLKGFGDMNNMAQMLSYIDSLTGEVKGIKEAISMVSQFKNGNASSTPQVPNAYGELQEVNQKITEALLKIFQNQEAVFREFLDWKEMDKRGS